MGITGKPRVCTQMKNGHYCLAYYFSPECECDLEVHDSLTRLDGKCVERRGQRRGAGRLPHPFHSLFAAAFDKHSGFCQGNMTFLAQKYPTGEMVFLS